MTSTSTTADTHGSTLRSDVAGRAVSRLLDVPRPSSGYTVHRKVRVPMRDGVELLADHYAPETATPAGTLLVRCPYGRMFPWSLAFGGFYAARDYHVIIQSVRGTFGSTGDFNPMVHEVDDGADTVTWLREQPWYTGSFATIGLSYLGFTQWALLTDPPADMAAAVISVGPHDFHNSTWGTGAFTINDFLGWSNMMAHQEDPGRIGALLRQVRTSRTVTRAAAEVPLGGSARALLADRARWFESWLNHPDAEDPFWEPMRLSAALDRVNIPVLLFGGWQDLFLDQTLAQFRHLHARGADVAMTVGPWTHMQMMTKAARTVFGESLDWLDTHLAHRRNNTRAAVHVHVAHHGWIDLPDFPPATSERVLYLEPGRLTAQPGDDTAGRVARSSFTFDPRRPTPTVGGRLLSTEAGYRRDNRFAERGDVLAFTGHPLTEDIYVYGAPVIELDHESDNPHVDVFVRISEVDTKGRSHNVSDGYRRLVRGPGNDTAAPLRLVLDEIAHRFRAGSRIRVLVAGGSHPRYARNLGTGEDPASGSRMAPATHVIHHGGSSRLLLPVGVAYPSTD